MNEYARIIEETWRRVRPGEIEQMSDPEAYLTRLGEDVEEEITERWPRLAGPDPEQETHLEKVARLNWARQQAASQVVREKLEELFGSAVEEDWESEEDEPEAEEKLTAPSSSQMEDSRDWLARELGMGPRA
ncbi:TnpV protein [Thermobifida halotolerans]|uniref:TnpV protein n=1 Tax=Thermobifida halotolerans TaxID=483545 RepID=A0AA97M5I7_9ACTN|nr:hypothetical protein [Thermobifida halotolerans]UOE21509.1 TnpV protein [Thermobifida halotolerans]